MKGMHRWGPVTYTSNGMSAKEDSSDTKNDSEDEARSDLCSASDEEVQELDTVLLLIGPFRKIQLLSQNRFRLIFEYAETWSKRSFTVHIVSADQFDGDIDLLK